MTYLTEQSHCRVSSAYPYRSFLQTVRYHPVYDSQVERLFDQTRVVEDASAKTSGLLWREERCSDQLRGCEDHLSRYIEEL